MGLSVCGLEVACFVVLMEYADEVVRVFIRY
jgi:hypothetical protein